ncbi:MAG: XdhC family protein [Candidatus Bathyarchaeia archaeon]
MTDPEIFSRLYRLLGEGRCAVLCTIVGKRGSGPREVGAKMLVTPEGETFGTIGGGGMERRLVEEALGALRDGRPRTLTFALGVEPRGGAVAVDSKCGGEVEILLDVIKPDPRLIVVGSGHIGKPLAELASRAGFEIIVIDDAETATSERFPMATGILSGPFEEELERVEVRPLDFVAIVHGETGHELAALRSMIPRKPAYIGLLGSRHKAAEHRRHLRAEGFSGEEVDAVRAPIGLDIGAETPEEIAVSIVAELIRARRRGPPRTAS